MEYRLKRICVALITVLCLGSTLWAITPLGRYRAQKLQSIAEYGGLDKIIDTLSNGKHFGIYNCGNTAVNIFVDNGVVEHIGASLFNEDFRSQSDAAPLFNYLERFLLENILSMPMRSGKLDFPTADGVRISKGKITDLAGIVSDTTLTFSYTFESAKKYTVTLDRNGRNMFTMTVPASYRVLGGYELDEAPRRLAALIQRADSGLHTSDAVDMEMLEMCDSLQGSYHVLRGGCYILPLVTNDKYYSVADSSASLLYSVGSYPVESLSNLLITGEIDNELTASVRLLQTRGESENFKVPLNSLLNFFRTEGYTPYFALIGLYPQNDRIVAMFEVVDYKNGFEHLMRVTASTSTLQRRQGEIDVRLAPYIPLHDVKTLYSKKKKVNIH